MPLSKEDREHLHALVEKYYPKKVDETGAIIPKPLREPCIRCGHKAILGARRPNVGACRKCRKEKRGDSLVAD